MGIEKRKERRVRADLPIKITAKNHLEVLGRTENISRLGGYVEAEDKIPLGQEVNIVLEIPGYGQDASLSGTVQCKGNIFRSSFLREVASQKYYGMGIFFTDFTTPADRDKLSRYIDFLVLKEEKELKAGLKHWQTRRSQGKKESRDTETVILLKQILGRLEELSQLLKSSLKSSRHS